MSNPRTQRIIKSAITIAQVIAFIANVIAAVQIIVSFGIVIWDKMRPKPPMGFTKSTDRRRRRSDEQGKRKCHPAEGRSQAASEHQQEEREEEACEQEHDYLLSHRKRHKRQNGRTAPGHA
jgi:hypothetical protein